MSNTDLPSRRNLPFRLSVPENDKLAVHVVYALYAATIVLAIPGMFGVLLAYLKRPEVSGTYLESHIHWQIRTFWLWLLMWFIGVVTAIVLVGWVILGFAQLWLLYRIIKGWLVLVDAKPIENPTAFF
ncbi:hypothetical protein [Thalassobaculum sp.]|uniref:DUF4870 family protein n=1 Tax=Thalassobaculum sp. TaxID=2022740 RepID=UPI0032EED06E